jgi:hypothetical protein
MTFYVIMSLWYNDIDDIMLWNFIILLSLWNYIYFKYVGHKFRYNNVISLILNF